MANEQDPDESEVPTIFWKRLEETWSAQGLETTQSAVAKTLREAGLKVANQSTPQRWYNGTSMPSRATLVAIAEKGKTTLDYLIAGWAPKVNFRRDKDLRELLNLWDCLDANGRRHVLDDAKGQAARAPEVREGPLTKSEAR